MSLQGKRILIFEDFSQVGVIPARSFHSSFDSSFVCGFPPYQGKRSPKHRANVFAMIAFIAVIVWIL
jgi:hypothetical protein